MTAVAEGEAVAPRSPAFIALIGLANAGGVIGFLPLLSLFLPVKIAQIAGDDRIALLTATVVAGALVASASNILFGWLSDRSAAQGPRTRWRGRRGWALGGLAGLGLSFIAVAMAGTPVQVVGAIMLFQLAVNAVLAPLFAIMADEVPGRQMGVAGGLIALGGPLASAVAALALALGSVNHGAQLAIVYLSVTLCVLPLLATHSRPIQAGAPAHERPLLGRDLTIAWTSRLLVQIAGSVLFLYIVYYFDSIGATRIAGQGVTEAAGKDVGRLGQLMTIAFLIPLPVALLSGRWSDRTGRRKPFLLATGLLAALGLAGMAVADGWNAGAVAFCVYATGSACFLALHSGFAMQLLPRPNHRGRDLGLINLTNTLPSLIGPVLTWLLATPGDFDAVMAILAALTAAGSLLILAIRGRA